MGVFGPLPGTYSLDLLPRAVPDVADVQLARARTAREAVGVAEPGRHDAPRVRVRARGERVTGGGRPRRRVRVDAHERAVEARRVARRAHVLRAERATLARGRVHHRRLARGRRDGDRVTARVDGRVGVARVRDRPAPLAVVVDREAGAVAPREVELAVRTEGHGSAAVAGELRAVVMQELDAARRGSDVRGEVDGVAGELAGDDAAVVRRARPGGSAGAAVVPDRRRPARGGVVDVVDVEVRTAGQEARVEDHVEQPAVPVIVHLAAEVEDLARRGVVDRSEGIHDALLLRDERAAIGGETDREGAVEPAEHRRVPEVRVCERAGRPGDRWTREPCHRSPHQRRRGDEQRRNQPNGSLSHGSLSHRSLLLSPRELDPDPSESRRESDSSKIRQLRIRQLIDERTLEHDRGRLAGRARPPPRRRRRLVDAELSQEHPGHCRRASSRRR